MKRLLMAAAYVAFMNVSFAGLVGDFSKTHNLPGYIDLNPKSHSFKGPYTKTIDYGDGVIVGTPSQILSKFLNSSGPDKEKIKKLITQIKIGQENARIAYCQAEQAEDSLTQVGCKNGFPREKLIKKWKKKSVNIAYNFALDKLKEAIKLSHTVNRNNLNSKQAQPFLEAFFDAIEVSQGLIQEDRQVSKSGMITSFRRFKEAIRPITIKKGRVEAANLVKPEGSGEVFYSPEELEQLKASGKDISLLNPPDSGFWRNPKRPINKYKTVNYNMEEVPYFKKELSKSQINDLLDPKVPLKVSYRIYVPKGTGETPKVYVQYGKSTLKVKFTTDRLGSKPTTNLTMEAMQLFRGMEVNTETVVNNIASALGFSIDGTYYKDVVKVFFEDEIYENNGFDAEYKRMVEILTTRYIADYNTGSALTKVKYDAESGRKYIELKHVQLERKSEVDTDMNIGFFIRKGLGKSLKREHRGFALFLAWVWDLDSKDSNNSLKLVPYKDENGKKRFKVAMSNSDMGATMASNRPNLYNYRLVRNYTQDENGEPNYIRFNYYRLYPNDLMDSISFDDAKWMARLMGQLTVEQIMNAHISAGYPPVVAKYLTGLMLRKRNRLLKALNLIGTTFVNTAGETVKLEKTWEFNGTLEGHEEFFREGFLTDPKNKLFDPERDAFPKFWGAGVRDYKGEPQEELFKLLRVKLLTTSGNLLYNSLLNNVSISNYGLNFREIGMSNTRLVDDCAGACFIQGFNAGVESFIPWRFVIDNPNKDSKAPFLVVDVFRLGFFLGHNTQKKFGLDIPGKQLFGIGAKHYQVSEFVKIRPINDITEFYNQKSDLFKMAKLNFRSAREDVIRNLKEEEVLIQSHYLGLRSSIRLQQRFDIYSFLTPSITLGGDMMAVNRVTFAKTATNKVMAGWNKIKQAAASVRLNLFDYLIQIPILENEFKKLRSVDRVFEFDLSKSEDNHALFSNLNKIIPSEVPKKYTLAQRTLNETQTRFSGGFLNLYRRTSFKKSIRVDFKDYLTQYEGSSLSYVREINRHRVTKTLGSHDATYKIQTSINSKNEIYAKIKLDGKFTDMTRNKFSYLLNKYENMLPENFIQFDPKAVNENFGTLEVEIETILSEKSLKDIFRKKITKYGLCTVYSKIHGYNWSTKDCIGLSKMKYVLPGPRNWRTSVVQKRFVKLWRRYEKARENFWTLTTNKKAALKKNKLLKSITELIEDNGNYSIQTMNLMLRLSKSDNYYRRASMYSAIAPFPGQNDYISQDVTVQGGFTPSNSMLSDNPVDEFELFMDSIHKTIENIFYNNRSLLGSSLGNT